MVISLSDHVSTASVQELHDQLASFFANELNLSLPSIDTDLVGTGLLDSLGLVEVMLHLERKFGVVVSLEQLEIDHFRSIVTIADFILRCGGPA